MSTVIAIKLTNGEEWIGKHVDHLDSTVVAIEDPRLIKVVPNGRGQQGIGLFPIFICSDNVGKITVGKHHVVSVIEVDTNFAKQYLQEVSGIQLI